MDKFSPTELILSAISVSATIYILVTKSSFFKGRQSVKQEIDDENNKALSGLLRDFQVMQQSIVNINKNMEHVSKEQKLVDARVLLVEKASLLQDQKLAQIEKLFERVLSQNETFQVNLTENSKAIIQLGASVDSVHDLLDNLIKGNLTIK
jgi:hypothetical protein